MRGRTSWRTQETRWNASFREARAATTLTPAQRTPPTVAEVEAMHIGKADKTRMIKAARQREELERQRARVREVLAAEQADS